ncbi:MAG: T9SS type A sorting domain-containing protein [Taibaiella sp.]|jgi:hypothetical protein
MKLSLSFISLFLMTNAFSQTSNLNTDLTKAKQRNLIFSILKEQQSQAVEKPTGINQRVIAQTTKGATYSDSASFVYSGTRGSKFNYNNLGYNRIFEATYEPGILYPRTVNPFDMLADTINYYSSDTLLYKDYAVYRPDNKCSLIITEYEEDYPFNRSKSVYTYNNSGFTDANYYSQYNDPGPFDTTFLERHSYLSGKLTTDSIWQKENGIWGLAGVDKYYYSPTGKVILDSAFYASGPGLQLGTIGNFTYYTNGNLATLTSTSFSGSTVSEILKDSLGYTDGIEYVTYWQTKWDNFSGNSSRLQEVIKYPGVSGSPDSTTFHINANGSESELTYYYQYNDFNNPEEITRFEDGNSSGTPDEINHFYYETYNDGLTIDEFKNSIDVNVYPNPFNDQIDVECKSLLSENCTFRLVNVVGIDIFSVHTAIRDGKVNLSFPQLPSGMYTLMIQSPDGHLLNKKMIKR